MSLCWCAGAVYMWGCHRERLFSFIVWIAGCFSLDSHVWDCLFFFFLCLESSSSCICVSVHMCEVHKRAHKRENAGDQHQFHFLVIIHIEFWDTCLSLAWGSLKQLVLAVQQVAWTSVFLPLFWSTGCFVWCIKCRPSHLQGKCWSY